MRISSLLNSIADAPEFEVLGSLELALDPLELFLRLEPMFANDAPKVDFDHTRIQEFHWSSECFFLFL